MKMIAHHGIAQYRTRKNLSQFGNAALDPRFSVFKRLLQITIPAAEPRSAHAAGKAQLFKAVFWLWGEAI